MLIVGVLDGGNLMSYRHVTFPRREEIVLGLAGVQPLQLRHIAADQFVNVLNRQAGPEWGACGGIRRSSHAQLLSSIVPRPWDSGSCAENRTFNPPTIRDMDRCCLWCGTELNPLYDGLYCCAAHREKQRLHRRKIEGQGLKTCPKPFKIPYPVRGEALRAAVQFQQWPYPCPCGVWHLSSQPQRVDQYKTWEALRELQAEMSTFQVSA